MSNQEKVARALAVVDGYPEVASGSADTTMMFVYGPDATAAIDALADVDALTSVIDLHVFEQQPDGSLTCIYDDKNTTEDYVGAHIAAAVVAWMKDRTL